MTVIGTVVGTVGADSIRGTGLWSLYHGSSTAIEHPVFGYGNPHNDYGLGFYCTESLDMAREWGCTAETDGVANRYEFDPTGLAVLDLSGDSYTVLHWLAILLEHRTVRLSGELAKQARAYIGSVFLPDYQSFDVIKGYRADDSYFAFASAFLNGAISYERLGEAMRLGELGEQVVPRTERAFERLRFVEALPADRTVYFARKVNRDTAARAAFRTMCADAPVATEHFVVDMLRERWGSDAAGLR